MNLDGMTARGIMDCGMCGVAYVTIKGAGP